MRIGIDIGGSHVGMGIVNDLNKIEDKIEFEYNSCGNMLESLKRMLEEGIDKISNSREIEIIGVSVPGIAKETVAENLVNLGIKKIDFKYLEEKYNTKVQVNNDANAATIAEKECGALKGYKDCVYICLGTGIGGGAYVNEKFLINSNHKGFEIGHMVIEKNGIQCACGKRGCFERHCSMDSFRKKIMNVLNEKYKDENKFKGKYVNHILVDEFQDENVQKVIDGYIDDLIVGISNIIDLFQPEAICFGGSFVFYKEFIFDKFVEEMKNRKYAFYRDYMPKFVLAELNNDAGIVGSVL